MHWKFTHQKSALETFLTDPMLRDAVAPPEHTCASVGQGQPVGCACIANGRPIVASDVCKAFGLYDSLKHNRFLEVTLMLRSSPALEEMVVANSALHMSNVFSRAVSPTATVIDCNGQAGY